MTKNLKWRLGKLPTPQEVSSLVIDKIISQDEAREILFTEGKIDDEVGALKEQIKFLKEIIEKVCNKTQIIETIKYIEKPYQHWTWYQPYQTWCSSNNVLNATNTGTTYFDSTNSISANATNVSFSAIS